MKKQDPVVIPEKIRIISINIIKANLDTSEAFLEHPKKAEGFEFSMAQEMGHNAEEGRSRCRIYFTMEARDSENVPIGLSIEYGIEFHFHIEDFKDFFMEGKEGEVKMDGGMGATLLAMAYSTARGIVFERTRGTFFDGVVLPIIDPYKALMENNGAED